MAILNELFDRTQRIDLGPLGHLDAMKLVETEESVFTVHGSGVLILEAGFTGTITDKLGHKRRYQDGKEVAAGGDQPANNPQPGKPPVHSLSDDERALVDKHLPDVDSLAASADPETAKKPGVLHALRRAAQAVMGRAALFCVAHEKTLAIAGEVLGAVFDTPSDMQKFGYNPATSAGTAGSHQAKGFDPIHNLTSSIDPSLGISTHLALSIGSKVIVAAYNFAKKKIAGKPTEGDQSSAIADLLHGLFTILAEEFGLPGPDSDKVLAAVKAHLSK